MRKCLNILFILGVSASDNFWAHSSSLNYELSRTSFSAHDLWPHSPPAPWLSSSWSDTISCSCEDRESGSSLYFWHKARTRCDRSRMAVYGRGCSTTRCNNATPPSFSTRGQYLVAVNRNTLKSYYLELSGTRNLFLSWVSIYSYHTLQYIRIIILKLYCWDQNFIHSAKHALSGSPFWKGKLVCLIDR